jgi:hypothetical protein
LLQLCPQDNNTEEKEDAHGLISLSDEAVHNKEGWKKQAAAPTKVGTCVCVAWLAVGGQQHAGGSAIRTPVQVHWGSRSGWSGVGVRMRHNILHAYIMQLGHGTPDLSRVYACAQGQEQDQQNKNKKDKLADQAAGSLAMKPQVWYGQCQQAGSLGGEGVGCQVRLEWG